MGALDLLPKWIANSNFITVAITDLELSLLRQ